MIKKSVPKEYRVWVKLENAKADGKFTVDYHWNKSQIIKGLEMIIQTFGKFKFGHVYNNRKAGNVKELYFTFDDFRIVIPTLNKGSQAIETKTIVIKQTPPTIKKGDAKPQVSNQEKMSLAYLAYLENINLH